MREEVSERGTVGAHRGGREADHDRIGVGCGDAAPFVCNVMVRLVDDDERGRGQRLTPDQRLHRPDLNDGARVLRESPADGTDAVHASGAEFLDRLSDKLASMHEHQHPTARDLREMACDEVREQHRLSVARRRDGQDSPVSLAERLPDRVAPLDLKWSELGHAVRLRAAFATAAASSSTGACGSARTTSISFRRSERRA